MRSCAPVKTPLALAEKYRRLHSRFGRSVFCPPACRFACLPACTSVCPRDCQFARPLVCLSGCLLASVYPSGCVSVCPLICLFAYPPTCPSVCPLGTPLVDWFIRLVVFCLVVRLVVRADI